MESQAISCRIGGSAIGAEGKEDTTLQDAAALKMAGVRVVLVHGGGKRITALLDRLQVPTEFVGGYRVTGEEGLEAAEMALSGQVNKSIVQELARLEGTLVFLMGLSRLEEIVRRLIGAGLPRSTPVAVIGGKNVPRAVRGTLGDIAGRVREAGLEAPAVIVAGGTAGMDLRT